VAIAANARAATESMGQRGGWSSLVQMGQWHHWFEWGSGNAGAAAVAKPSAPMTGVWENVLGWAQGTTQHSALGGTVTSSEERGLDCLPEAVSVCQTALFVVSSNASILRAGCCRTILGRRVEAEAYRAVITVRVGSGHMGLDHLLDISVVSSREIV